MGWRERLSDLIPALTRRPADEEVDEEIRVHLELETQQRLDAGLSPDEAYTAARRTFGNVSLVKEDTRAVWGFRGLDEFRQDVGYGARMLLRSPGFTAAAVLTLALGIGATSAIFSVLNAVLLRPLPFPDPERLVQVREINVQQGRARNADVGTFLAWREESRTFEQLAQVSTGRLPTTLQGAAGAEPVLRVNVGLNVFQVLGREAILGRTYRPDDVLFGPGPYAEGLVISHALWQRRFGGDPDVLGQRLRGSPFSPEDYRVILGVMPPDFWITPGSKGVDAWSGFDMARFPPSNRRFGTLGRLKPGVSLEQAEAELTTIAGGREGADLATTTAWRVEIQPMHEWVSARYTETLYLLLGAVAFVLAIACANVANLQLSRAATRQTEMATRVALGAGRLRLVRQLLTENLLLALLGGGLGVLVSVVGMRLFVLLAPEWYPPTEAIRVDATVLLFTLGTALLTGLLFGLVPALRASRPDLHDSLKQGARRGTGGSRQGVRRLLVVAEVALALVLLVGAGLMIQSYVRVLRVEMGFDPDNLLTMEINLNGSKYVEPTQRPTYLRVTPEVARFYEQVLDRIAALPGVETVGMTSALPPTRGQTRRFTIVGSPELPAEVEETRARYQAVRADFFRTMRMPLIRGRVFSERDAEEAAGVVILNETAARQFFPGEDPIGHHAQVHVGDSAPEGDRLREIVGIVGDIRLRLRDEPEPVLYVPHHQHLWEFVGGTMDHTHQDLVVRTAANPVGLAAAVRDLVAEVDPDQAVEDLMPMRQRLSDSAGSERFWLRLLGLFAALAVFLAAIGIYGVISYGVTQRTHEFGVRTALGAQKTDILTLVVGEGVVVSLIGVAIGVGAAFGLTRLIANQLFGVTPMDPMTIAAVALVLMGVALIACYVPARRATKVDPVVALRAE